MKLTKYKILYCQLHFMRLVFLNVLFTQKDESEKINKGVDIK